MSNLESSRIRKQSGRGLPKQATEGACRERPIRARSPPVNLALVGSPAPANASCLRSFVLLSLTRDIRTACTVLRRRLSLPLR